MFRTDEEYQKFKSTVESLIEGEEQATIVMHLKDILDLLESERLPLPPPPVGKV